MQRWISHSIAPLGIILLFLLIIVFFSADYISKKILQTCNLLLILLLILYLSFGIYTIVLATQQSTETTFIKNGWTLLSAYSKIYYYKNDINVLYQTYFLNMLVTGGIYLFIFLCTFFLMIFTYVYTEKIDIIWRPPLRSKLRDERASRYINYYSMYNKEYKMLLEMQNRTGEFKQNKESYPNYVNSNQYNNAENLALKSEDHNNKNQIYNPNNFENINYDNSKINSQEVNDNKNNNILIPNNRMIRENLEYNNQLNIKQDKNVNNSGSKKNLLMNENKNVDANQISGSLDKNSVKNNIDNSIQNNIHIDERSKILDKKHDNISNPNVPRKLVRKKVKKNKNIEE